MKKMIFVLSFVILFFIGGDFVSANSSDSFNELKATVETELGSNVEVFPIEPNELPQGEGSILKFDTVDKFLEFNRTLKEQGMIGEEISTEENTLFRSSRINAVKTFSFRPPVFDAKKPFTIKAIVNYDYTSLGVILKRLDSINRVTSYSTVVAIADWKHLDYTVNRISERSANITIIGALEYLVDIGGVKAGYRMDGITYKCELDV